MGILLLKFGGSSLATIEKIQAVAQRIATISRQHRCAVVVSAMGEDTDILLEQAAVLHPKKHAREYDMLLATGEQKTIALMSMALQELQIPARSLTGWQAKIQTTAQHARARIVHVDTHRIEQCFKNNEIPIIAGFQGYSYDEITTLGRGGSDLTAVALAAALAADECQIFTDVDGVYSADPRIVPHAVKWKKITYDMMLELASVGAEVLHHRAVELACKMQVNLRVLSTFTQGEGTMVTQHLKKVPTVSGITSQAEQAVFSVICRCSPAHRAALFTLLYQHKVQLNTIHFSHHQDDQATLSFALPVEGVTGMRKAISALMQQDLQLCEHHVQQTQVSIVGLGIQSSDRVITELYDYFAEKSLTVRLMTSSEVRISFYVEASLAPQVIRDLHDLFHLAIESI